MKLIEMINIGKSLSDELITVGLKDSEDLIRAGSIGAVTLLGYKTTTCSNKLYALEGAIQGIRWHELPKDLRKELLDEYKRHLTEE